MTTRPPDDDGYRLWLRYERLPDGPYRTEARATFARVALPAPSPTLAAARAELARGLGGLLGDDGVRFGDGETQPATLIAGTLASYPGLGRLGLDPASQTRVLEARNSVLFAPDLLRVDLAGEGPAPGSKARAFMSRSSGVAFAADQLPALPADKVYQLWIVPQGAAAVSAGLLTPDANGHASLFFPMPADVTAPQALAVTVEPAGGVPAPTGSRVLLGTVPVATPS